MAGVSLFKFELPFLFNRGLPIFSMCVSQLGHYRREAKAKAKAKAWFCLQSHRERQEQACPPAQANCAVTVGEMVANARGGKTAPLTPIRLTLQNVTTPFQVSAYDGQSARKKIDLRSARDPRLLRAPRPGTLRRRPPEQRHALEAPWRGRVGLRRALGRGRRRRRLPGPL